MFIIYIKSSSLDKFTILQRVCMGGGENTIKYSMGDQFKSDLIGFKFDLIWLITINYN
jgi:hypothetical protein